MPQTGQWGAVDLPAPANEDRSQKGRQMRLPQLTPAQFFPNTPIMTFASTSTLTTPTGAALRLCHEPASAKPRGIVQINHGLAEHAARYARFAKALSAAGYHVYAHDHRGHGFTKAPDAPLGRFAEKDGGEKVLDDVMAVRRHATAAHPGLPLIIFGHSMGGLIAMNSVLRDPEGLSAACIWNCNFSAGALGRLAQFILAAERMMLGSDVPSMVLPKLTFGDWAKKETDGRTAFDWLSRDHGEVDKYVADPLCGWNASVSMWQDIFGFVFKGASDASFKNIPKSMPFNLHGGKHDASTDFGKALSALASRMRTMGFTNVTLEMHPDDRHECLNDLNRGAITAQLLNWLGQIRP
jgi:alpha-beta hydrolase superfamily lysophospholipase